MTKRLAFMLTLALAACGSRDSGQVEYPTSGSVTVTVRSPQLVPVDEAPGVFVLADANEPVFYTDNAYWLFRDGRWYRSQSFDRDFVTVTEAPTRLRRINEPLAYARYQTRRQEARNMPQQAPRDPWIDEQGEQSDAPSTVPPHQQQPLDQTQPPPPYPQPPQQESPTHDDHNVTPQTVPPPSQVDRDIEPGQGTNQETTPDQPTETETETETDTDAETGTENTDKDEKKRDY